MSLERDKQRLELYLQAEAKLLSGKRTVEISGMKFHEIGLAKVQEKIDQLETRIANAEGSGGFSVSAVVFRGDI